MAKDAVKVPDDIANYTEEKRKEVARSLLKTTKLGNEQIARACNLKTRAVATMRSHLEGKLPDPPKSKPQGIAPVTAPEQQPTPAPAGTEEAPKSGTPKPTAEEKKEIHTMSDIADIRAYVQDMDSKFTAGMKMILARLDGQPVAKAPGEQVKESTMETEFQAFRESVHVDSYRRALFDQWKAITNSRAQQNGGQPYTKDLPGFLLDCIPGDEEVLTIKGGEYVFQKIKDIAPGTLVPSYDFRNNGFCMEPVINLLDKGTLDVYEITLRNGMSFRATENHAMYIYEGNHSPPTIKEMTIGQLTRKIGKSVDDYPQQRFVSAMQIPDLGGEEDPAKLWVQGLWTADGWHTGRNKAGTPIGGGDIALFSEELFRELQKRLTSLGVSAVGTVRGKKHRVYIPKRIVGSTSQMTADSKHFPDGSSSLKREFIAELLDGYFEGDGSEADPRKWSKTDRRIYTTISPRLRDELAILHLILGKPLYFETVPKEKLNPHRFNGHEIVNNHDLFRLYDEKHLYSDPVQPSISKTAFKKIEKVGQERVYDINVMGTHNFILKSSVIAHNCMDEFFENRGIDFTYQETRPVRRTEVTQARVR